MPLSMKHRAAGPAMPPKPETTSMRHRIHGRSLSLTIALLLLLTSCTGIARAQQPSVPGPAQDVAVLDVPGGGANAWNAKSGSNVAFSVRQGVTLPDLASPLLAFYVTRKDAADGKAGDNWFAASRQGIVSAVPAGIDGFRFRLASEAEVQWWVSVGLSTSAGETYSCVIADHPFPARREVEYEVSLERFKTAAGKALTAATAREIGGLSLTLSAPGTTLYLGRITAYRAERYSSWLDFTTNRPENNVFERTAPVRLVFTVDGTPPSEAAGFRYEVVDYYGSVTEHAIVPLSRGPHAVVNAARKAPGYYEVHAFWVDAAGKDVEKRSCIRSEGTVPMGTGTFAVLPGTIQENTARFRRLGQNAFFGLHGDFLGLADRIGLAWRLDYSAWKYLEPQKPDRSAGPAPWAKERSATAPLPAYRLGILPFVFNNLDATPDWARSDTGKAPAFRDWDDAMAVVRDQTKVARHLYAGMKPRIYGGAWEVNLNMPPGSSQQPPFTPQDVVEVYRRVQSVVKAEDPGGIVIGPCANTLNPAWFEEIFRAGVLHYVDGIETHGYSDGAFTPEANDTPGKIARIRSLMRQIGGRELPIYCTECGEVGMLGSRAVCRSQAERMVRASIIFKGEGLRAFLPFYGIDYNRDEGWGFCFNLEVDGNPWGTHRISPKPVVNTMAVCALLLEGAKPAGRLRSLGKDVWAYRFVRDGTTITAVWTPGKPRTVTVPLGAARTVSAQDILGRPLKAHLVHGTTPVRISESPVYLLSR